VRPEGFRGTFREDELARAVYSEGAGIAREIPEAVAVPVDTQDVEAIVRWAGAEGKSLIPRGSGSGMAGGAVGPGIILDLSRLRQMVSIGSRGSIWAEPGVLCKTVMDAAREKHKRFPVDPSSAAFCTIGGMTSTNAAGPHSLRSGSMREWVRAIDCVFSDGSRGIIERGAPLPVVAPIQRFLESLDGLRDQWAEAAHEHSLLLKDSSGYALTRFFESGDLVDLLVGSEGTLAVIVGVELLLSEAAPVTGSVLAAFPTLESAARGADAARGSGAAACELLDRTFLEFASRDPQSGEHLGDLASDSATAAVLIAEIEADDRHEADDATRVLSSAFEKAGATAVKVALTAAAEREVWDLRHAASPILSRLTNLTSMQFIEDGAVPPDRLPEYVLGIRKSLQDRGVEGVIFGHAGDANVHVNPLIDLSRTDWRETVAGLLSDAVALTSRLDGTLTGEHGDGRLRTPLMREMWSEGAMRAFGEVKRCFDPLGTLNPGVKVPLASQQALGRIKYDPALPPLPPKARAALDGVVARRAYSDFRLSLID
jgi:FAD/FMN-containing dehydrogenase